MKLLALLAAAALVGSVMLPLGLAVLCAGIYARDKVTGRIE